MPTREEDEAVLADREYRRLVVKAAKAAQRRADLPAGSPRARVTTANARWAVAAEARDLRERQVREFFRARQG